MQRHDQIVILANWSTHCSCFPETGRWRGRRRAWCDPKIHSPGKDMFNLPFVLFHHVVLELIHAGNGNGGAYSYLFDSFGNCSCVWSTYLQRRSFRSWSFGDRPVFCSPIDIFGCQFGFVGLYLVLKLGHREVCRLRIHGKRHRGIVYGRWPFGNHGFVRAVDDLVGRNIQFPTDLFDAVSECRCQRVSFNWTF